MSWFELALLGGPAGRRLARRREAAGVFDWGAIGAAGGTPAARDVWTRSAFSDYASAAAFTEIAGGLLAAGAPLDLAAAASDFALDEVVHCELAARVAAAYGGAAPLDVDLRRLVRPPAPGGALREVAERIVRACCVGEAATVGVLRAAADAARPGPVAPILDALARDEAEHAAFGWFFLDWAGDRLTDADRVALAAAAGGALADLAPLLTADCAADPARGVLSCAAFDPALAHALEARVRAPLRARSIPV